MVGFSEMPTLGQLVLVATRPPYDWKKGETPGVANPRGEEQTIRYLYRESKITPGSQEHVDLLLTKDDDRLTRIAFASLCRRLGLFPEDFGLPNSIIDF